MGVFADRDGVTVQLYTTDGTPDGQPQFGRYAGLLADTRASVLGQPGAVPPTPQENSALGSSDWLTLIAVADTEEKLKDLMYGARVSLGNPLSSGASRRVRLRTHIGKVKREFEDRVTIASGPLHPESRISVVHVKVLPPNLDLEDCEELKTEFLSMSPFVAP